MVQSRPCPEGSPEKGSSLRPWPSGYFHSWPGLPAARRDSARQGGGWGPCRKTIPSPARMTLASGTETTVRLWRAADGKLLRTFQSPGNSLKFSPDGKRLAGRTGKMKPRFGYLEARDGEGVRVWGLSDSASGGSLKSSDRLPSIEIVAVDPKMPVEGQALRVIGNEGNDLFEALRQHPLFQVRRMALWGTAGASGGLFGWSWGQVGGGGLSLSFRSRTCPSSWRTWASNSAMRACASARRACAA